MSPIEAYIQQFFSGVGSCSQLKLLGHRLSMFSDFTRYCYTVFQSGCYNLNSHQKTIKIHFSHILTNPWYLQIFQCLLNWWVKNGISLWFNLHFLDYWLRWVFPPVYLLAIWIFSILKFLFHFFIFLLGLFLIDL